METIIVIVMAMAFVYSIVFHVYLSPAMESTKVGIQKNTEIFSCLFLHFITRSKKQTNRPSICFHKQPLSCTIQSSFTSTTWPFSLHSFSTPSYAFSTKSILSCPSFLSGFYWLIIMKMKVGPSSTILLHNCDISPFHSSS